MGISVNVSGDVVLVDYFNRARIKTASDDNPVACGLLSNIACASTTCVSYSGELSANTAICDYPSGFTAMGTAGAPGLAKDVVGGALFATPDAVKVSEQLEPNADGYLVIPANGAVWLAMVMNTNSIASNLPLEQTMVGDTPVYLSPLNPEAANDATQCKETTSQEFPFPTQSCAVVTYAEPVIAAEVTLLAETVTMTVETELLLADGSDVLDGSVGTNYSVVSSATSQWTYDESPAIQFFPLD
jgi:hypothetical protein